MFLTFCVSVYIIKTLDHENGKGGHMEEKFLRRVAMRDRQYVNVELISTDAGTVIPTAVIWQYKNRQTKRFPIDSIIYTASTKAEPDFSLWTDVYNVTIGKDRRTLYCEKRRTANDFDMRWYVRRKV